MKNEQMALLFSEATPYIQKYHGKTLVIKYGGNAMVNDELKLAVMNDLVTLTLLGVRVVLVPVSYTHLDVYKRQIPNCIFPEELGMVKEFVQKASPLGEAGCEAD